VSVEWKGEEVQRKLIENTRRAMDGLMAACVTGAKSEHAFKNRTGILEGSIQVAEFAHEEGSQIIGRWGSKSVNYAHAIEVGYEPYTIKNGFGRGILIRHPGSKGMPFLVPQAEKHYPTLTARIRAEEGNK
jgi:hypothetical protein